MKAVAVFLLFLGMFFVLQGYYSKDKKTKCNKTTTQIKYLPRSVYEEQIASGQKGEITRQFKGMFEDANPWYPKRG